MLRLRSRSDANRLEPHVFRIAVVIVLGAIMSILDTTIVNVALRSLSTDLGTSLDDIQWVVTAYLLALGATIPLTGWLARRIGARRLYLIALVVFIGGSALCGLAWSAGSLIGFRVLQGLGGGMVMPVGQMILVRAAGPKNLARVMSAIGVPMILAPVLGPTLGGLLIEHAGWQWIFFVNVPIGAVAVVAALRLLPREAPETAGPLDVLGFVLAGVGVVGVTYGLAESGHTGSLAATSVLVPLAIGLALIAVFVVRALRIEHPLLDMRLYANRAFSAAALTTFALGAALFGGMILMPLYFQIVRGDSVVETGLLLIPQGIGAALAMHYAGRATERFGGGPTALVGTVVMLVATIPFTLIADDTPYALINAAMFLRGFGLGLCMMPAWTAAFAVLRPDQVGDATPQLTVVQRVGGSIGTAVLTVILQGHLDDAGRSASAQATAFADTYLWVIGISLLAIAPTILLTLVERRAARDEHEAMDQARMAEEAVA
ncbi:DHA2 family efflux MFS transporter permease subunit [Capillimicrobium parvum]|uniref:Transport protein HsrA n=1 Tax=Capillimicrobium parvum TaxID=2884022 RepID=A0A9E6XUE8_9ACTN|nr:DHA2 family efflux MFS transporter permease subunit [Capillimicrobium parvum]UGS34313.1 putative transport protein HsrA [Capillimicrobium parvum]